MTLGTIAVKARNKTHTDTSSYTDANLLIDVNIWYEKIAMMILDSMDDADFDDARLGSSGSSGTADYPIQTTPMVAGQRDYSMPVSQRMLKLKRVDVTYDGTHWYRAEPFDSGTYPYGMGSDTEIDANFIREAPRYDIKFNSLFIYPLPSAADVSAGAKVRTEWDRNVIVFTTADYTSVLTDSTQVPGIDSNFHGMIADGAAYEKALQDNLPQLAGLKQDMQDWEVRLRGHYGKKDLDLRLHMQPGDDQFNSYR